MKTILLMTLFSFPSHSGDKTFCHEADQRQPSMISEIGRVLPSKSGRVGRRKHPSACSATMISANCAISAGHCVENLKYMEFQVPRSVDHYRLRHPQKKDIYEIDKATIKSAANGPGDDWAVFKVKRNSVTGLNPGDVQGFLEIGQASVFTTLRITGYGADHSPRTRHFTQQTDIGEFISINGSKVEHTVDTMGGNSGSSIINEETGAIMGIHTHGGCTSTGANSGTYIQGHQKLLSAIKSCLAAN